MVFFPHLFQSNTIRFILVSSLFIFVTSSSGSKKFVCVNLNIHIRLIDSLIINQVLIMATASCLAWEHSSPLLGFTTCSELPPHTDIFPFVVNLNHNVKLTSAYVSSLPGSAQTPDTGRRPQTPLHCSQPL